MNKRFFRMLGTTGLIGASMSVLWLSPVMAASGEDKEKVLQAEQQYISEVAAYCSKLLFGERGMVTWNERYGKAYKGCLQEYGVLYSHRAVDPDQSERPTAAQEREAAGAYADGKPVTEEMIAEADAAIEKIRKEGASDNPYSLNRKGKAVVADRLKKQGLNYAYGVEDGSGGASSVEKEEERSKPVYIYKKPKSDDEESAPSRVFQGYE